MNSYRSNELAAWLRLTLTPGVGGRSQRKLLRAFSSPENIYCSSYSNLAAVVDSELAHRLIEYKATEAINKSLQWLAADQEHHILTLADAEYPQSLLNIPDPPSVLYARGKLAALNCESVAVVGSRHATPQGLRTARDFAGELTRRGYCVVSGLALGIDSEAHTGAMQAEGLTVAVLGTGTDLVYPRRNQSLCNRILENGAVISEFPLSTPPVSQNFPRRNRLISGLSSGVLVVEATVESGSLITARMAVEQGREVFAIPGSIHSPFARGCHLLLKEGAKLVETASDIVDELNIKCTQIRIKPEVAGRQMQTKTDMIEREPVQPSKEEAELLQAIGMDACNFDEIAGRTGKSADILLQQLLKLELDGHIASLPGNQYQRTSWGNMAIGNC